MGPGRLGDLSPHSLEAWMIILSGVALILAVCLLRNMPGPWWVWVLLFWFAYLLLSNQ